MPNAKVLSEKQAVVSALVDRIKASSAGVLVDYKGITVAEDTALRSEMRKDGVNYTVIKNTLVRKALDQLDLGGLDGVLRVIAENGFDIEYMYSIMVSQGGSAGMIFRVREPEKLWEILKEAKNG